MDDDELEYWGAYARNVTQATPLLDGQGPSGDMLAMWAIIGALEEKVRNAQAVQ